jgi:glycosyltransferase involved in cell wall biosynthesis
MGHRARPLPTLAVVIATRNRDDAIVRCCRSVLATPDRDLEVAVVDQSDDDSTVSALAELLADPRLRHHRSASRGLAAGRNAGFRLTSAPVVAMTDDDCEVASDWIREVRRVFGRDPRTSLAFGSVLAAPHDASRGFIPSCPVADEIVGTRLRDKVRLDGMGACMAMRRDVWQAFGGFDELLGAGTSFLSGEETDFCLRALLAGHAVGVTPRMVVVHHGFRPHADAGALGFGYWYGTGAAFAKLLRCGHPSILGLLARLGWRWLFSPSPIARSIPAATSRRAWFWAFLRGAWAARRIPVEARQGIFREPTAPR